MVIQQGRQRRILLAPELNFPARKFAESKATVAGTSGGGKSSFVRVLLEQLYSNKVPFAVVDPVGLYWGLRSSFRGEVPSGNRILVVGGERADIDIDAEDAYDLGQAVTELDISCVMDTSLMLTKDMRKFVQGFADAVYRTSRSTRHVVIEEAAEVLPLRPSPAQEPCHDILKRMVTLGRNRAIGVTSVTQRLAMLSPDARSQSNTLLIFGVIGPTDREAVMDWIKGARVPPKLLDDMDKGLASLGKREGWAWSPSLFGLFTPFYTRTFRTLHPDRTHLETHRINPDKAKLTDVSDLVMKVQERMGLAARKKKEEATAEELREKVQELEAKLRENAVFIGPDPEATRKEVERAVHDLDARFKDRTGRLCQELRRLEAELAKAAQGNATVAEVRKKMRELAKEEWR